MAKSFIAIFFAFTSLFATGQIYIGPKDDIHAKSADFSEEDLEALKSGNLVIGLPLSASDKPDMIAAMLKNSWAFGSVQVVNEDVVDEYLTRPNTPVMKVQDITLMADGPYGRQGETQTFLRIMMNHTNKYGETSKKSWCRIELDNRLNPEYNRRPSFIAVYLRTLSGFLSSGKERRLYNSTYDPHMLSRLKGEVLYIPECLLQKTKDTRFTPQEFMKKYPWRYEFVSLERLDSIIANPSADTYFLQGVVSSPEKFVTVFNARTGDIVYSEYIEYAKSMLPKDIATLASRIK